MGAFGHFLYNRYSLLFIDKIIWLEISDIPRSTCTFSCNLNYLVVRGLLHEPLQLFLTKVSPFNVCKSRNSDQESLDFAQIIRHHVFS